MSQESPWMSEEQAADWLGIPREAIREAVRSGEIPALVIRDFVRISQDALLGLAATSFSSAHVAATPPTATRPEPQTDSGLPIPDMMSWIENLAQTEEFSIPWPQTGGGSHSERYPAAWRGIILLNNTRIEVKVGECIRHDRGRLTVLFDRSPICEFVATTDGEGWASVIKPDGKKVLNTLDDAPPLYRNAHIASYRDATGMTGIGVPKGLAVLVARNDHRSTVHHAAARWLGKHRFPVVPAA